MTTKKEGYKFGLKTSQSLTTGTFGFEGAFYFDDPKDLEKNKAFLLTMIQEQEVIFENAGYKVASTIPTNLEKNQTILTKKMEAAEAKRRTEAEAMANV